MLKTIGWISVIPVALAIILAYASRNTIVSSGITCIVGGLLVREGFWGFKYVVYRKKTKQRSNPGCFVAASCAVAFLLLK